MRVWLAKGLANLLKLVPQLVAGHAEGGVVRAGEDAAYVTPIGRSDDRRTQVAGRRHVLQAAALFARVHVNVAVRAIRGAQAAADAVTFDLDLFAKAVAMDCIDRTADEAVGVRAGAATAGHEPLVDSHAFAHQPRDAVVRVAAGFRAFVAAGAGFEVEDEQALGVEEALVDEGAAVGGGGRWGVWDLGFGIWNLGFLVAG